MPSQLRPQEGEVLNASAAPPAQHLDDSDINLFRQITHPSPFISTFYNPIDAITSYLGSRNPFYHRVEPDKHTVWLLDNTAYRQPGSAQPWQAEFVAAYFVKNSGRDVSAFVADIVEKVGLAFVRGEDRKNMEERVASRLQPLLDQVLPAHTVDVDIGGTGMVKRLGPSGRSGVSCDLVVVAGEHADGSTIDNHVIGVPSVDCTTTFAEATGWAVISDIDDTIKLTQTPSPIGVLKTTFIEEPEAIAGMPELYRYIVSTLANPPFWYLSASPYNLYPFLHSFVHSTYPAGTMVLREASWMNLAAFISSLTKGTQAYKVDRMERIHQSFPDRKFVCLGDSTQTDPESYGEVYRKWPGWIAKIFIRKVYGIAGMDEEEKNSAGRFEKAFNGVPTDVWRVFDDSKELYGEIDRLVG